MKDAPTDSDRAIAFCGQGERARKLVEEFKAVRADERFAVHTKVINGIKARPFLQALADEQKQITPAAEDGTELHDITEFGKATLRICDIMGVELAVPPPKGRQQIMDMIEEIKGWGYAECQADVCEAIGFIRPKP